MRFCLKPKTINQIKADCARAGFEDDRCRCSRLLCGKRCWSAGRGDYPHLTTDQISDQRRELINSTLRPPIFDCYVLALKCDPFRPAPLRKADKCRAKRCEEPALTKPIEGSAGCWARAVTGQVAAEQPSSAMKSRRLMSLPRVEGRAGYMKDYRQLCRMSHPTGSLLLIQLGRY